jgi:hypothetical protein
MDVEVGHCFIAIVVVVEGRDLEVAGVAILELDWRERAVVVPAVLVLGAGVMVLLGFIIIKGVAVTGGARVANQVLYSCSLLLCQTSVPVLIIFTGLLPAQILIQDVKV